MAAREGQGLQIAVIMFAMLTIILAITTYIFYAQSASAKKERDAAVKQRGDEQLTNNKLEYQITAMKYVLGMPGVTRQEIDLAQGKAGGPDQAIEEMLKKFDAEMAALGDSAAPDEAKNYGTLAKILLASVNRKNASVADANAQTRKSQADMAAVEKREQERANASETSANKYKADLDTASQQYTAARTDLQGQLDKFIAESSTKEQKAKAEIDAATKDQQKLATQINQQQNTIQRYQDDIKNLTVKQNLFESPDGKIIWVNQRQRLVWIDVGRADGLLRQTTFRVYPHDENGIASSQHKGSIEVMQVTGDHLAEARILEDSVSNPILPGDVIHTPAWTPGQRIRFALVGKMDIDDDQRDDYERVRGIIEANGGIIDAELRPDGTRTGALTVNTRYFVLGQIEAEAASQKMLSELTNMENERRGHGIEKISVGELLSLMGWKAEERTVSLGGAKGDFRKRTPGKPQPASPGTAAAPAATPATTEPATPAATVDPFAAPAPGLAPAPEGNAPAVVDPFAVPK